MALSTSKCNDLTPLRLKGLNDWCETRHRFTSRVTEVDRSCVDGFQ